METNSEHEGESVRHKIDVVKGTQLSKADKVSQKLKLIAAYVLDGFAPVVAGLALILAVMNFQSAHSDQTQISQANAKLEKLSAELSLSKSELDKIKNLLLLQKVNMEKDSKIQDELTKKVSQNVSQMQIKMKISPTLEDQLHSALTPAVSTLIIPAGVSAGTAKKN